MKPKTLIKQLLTWPKDVEILERIVSIDNQLYIVYTISWMELQEKKLKMEGGNDET